MTDEERSTVDRKDDPRWYTADRVPIVDGLWVWTYDLRPAVVSLSESDPDRKYWDGWFRAVEENGHTALMNGERMVTVHPFTRERVTPFPDPLYPGLVAEAEAGERLVVADDRTGGLVAVENAPRVAGDPTPWREVASGRRHRSEAVSVRPAR